MRRRHHRHEAHAAWAHKRRAARRAAFGAWLRWLEGPDGTRWLARRLGGRLHHRLFWGFGFAIAAGAGAAWITRWCTGGEHGVGWSIAVGAAVLWIASGGIARRITRPVVELVEVAEALGQGHLDRRMRPTWRRFDDLAIVARSFNAMAERIQRQLADQRELLAAVSHELRTPLGHLRVLVDTARDRPGDAAPLDALERELVEVDRLVGQLLATSRLDFGQLDARALSGAELAVRALEQLGVDAALLDVQADDTAAQGDPTLLLAAISNLVRNAEGHGRGLRALIVRRDDGALIFEAHDDGPGFEPGTHDKVFESFWRGERRAGGSLGLGLALVRRIAAAHGGETWARDRPEGGAAVGFSVRAPAG